MNKEQSKRVHELDGMCLFLHGHGIQFNIMVRVSCGKWILQQWNPALEQTLAKHRPSSVVFGWFLEQKTSNFAKSSKCILANRQDVANMPFSLLKVNPSHAVPGTLQIVTNLRRCSLSIFRSSTTLRQNWWNHIKAWDHGTSNDLDKSMIRTCPTFWIVDPVRCLTKRLNHLGWIHSRCDSDVLHKSQKFASGENVIHHHLEIYVDGILQHHVASKSAIKADWQD